MGLAEMKSQNVGINATGAAPDNSAGLDVNFTNKGVLFPKVNLTSITDAVTIPSPATGLMIWNTNSSLPCGVGFYYNAGTPASPVWQCFKKQTQVFHATGTAGRLAVTSTAHTAQPGLSITFTIPPGQTADVVIQAYIGMRNTSTTAGQYSIVDVIIYRNGSFIPVGGWNRVETLNSSSFAQNAFNTTSINTKETLGAGTYTYEIRSARFSGNTSVDIGGNCATDTNCGELTITVHYK